MSNELYGIIGAYLATLGTLAYLLKNVVTAFMSHIKDANEKLVTMLERVASKLSEHDDRAALRNSELAKVMREHALLNQKAHELQSKEHTDLTHILIGSKK